MKIIKIFLFWGLVSLTFACGNAENKKQGTEKTDSTGKAEKNEKKIEKKSEAKEDKSTPTNDEPVEKEVDKSVE